MCRCEEALSEISKRLAAIELLLQRPRQASSCIPLNDTEKKIVAVLAAKPLKGAVIARRLERAFNAHFKATMSFLVRFGVLGKCRGGYCLITRTKDPTNEDRSDDNAAPPFAPSMTGDVILLEKEVAQ